MSTASKTVLMVAGEFPPMKTIGRIRSAKFAQHLTELGWKVVVLTVESNEDSPVYDASLETEIAAGVEVFRAPNPNLETLAINWIKRLLGRSIPSADTNRSRAAAAPASSQPSIAPFRIIELPLRFFKYVIKHWINIPDDYLPWSRKAYRLALKICAERRIDVVYTSLPPFSAAFIGYRIKKRLGIPWVVDYRDLWYRDVLREWIGPVRQRLELALERHLLKQADIIITVSAQKTAYLKQMVPDTKACWETLTNGYDPEIYEPLLTEPRKIDDVIDFTFTGRLFKNRRGYAFAEALGQLVEAEPALKERVLVHILGGVSPEIRDRYREILTKYGINQMFEFAGDVSYQEAMRAQVHTDYLLLIVDTGATSDGVIPGKLFEYVAARRPIFALTDPGATKEIIEQAGIGRVVPAESVAECKAALRSILTSEVPRRLTRNEAYLSQFERKSISLRLARIFDSIATPNISDSTGDALRSIPSE